MKKKEQKIIFNRNLHPVLQSEMKPKKERKKKRKEEEKENKIEE